MRPWSLWMLVLLVAASGEGHAWGQARSQLLDPSLIARFGLTRAWNAQVELDAARARVGHVTQHVSSTQGVTIVDVVLVDDEQQKLETFTDRQLDPFGKPYGPEGAKKAAERRIADLRAIGVTAKAITTVVPEITLYVTTDNGFLHAINGETGATRWVIPVGRPDHPTYAPAANDLFVAAINGMYLFVFHAEDGRLAWSRRLEYVPGAGPAITYEHVHAPMLSGLMETYHLTDAKARRRVYQSFGRIFLQPTATPASLTWATDRGYLYVGNADQPGMRFRLETQAEIVARPAWLPPNRMVCVSLDGDVYCVNEFTGALLWRFSTGDPIDRPPLTIGDDVYVVTSKNTLYRLSAETGGVGAGAAWSKVAMRRVLAASNDRLYCLDHIGRLTILDRATGGRVAALPEVLPMVEFTNQQTDRLFFVSDKGLIQCFREVGREYPIVYAGAGVEAKAPPPKEPEPKAPADAPPAEQPAPVNPFAAGDDNPFGGAGADGANPFGGGAPAPAPAGADDNPFGGDDPFGGAGAAPPNTPQPAPAASGDPFSDPFAVP